MQNWGKMESDVFLSYSKCKNASEKDWGGRDGNTKMDKWSENNK